MKRTISIILAAVMLLFLVACGKSAETKWQEQYDLGVRYLSEGKYEEAIIAFTAAIEIAPKQPETYEKMAETYIALGDIDSARDILEQGINATGEDSLRERLNEIKNLDSIVPPETIDLEDTLDHNDVLVNRSDGTRYVYEYDATGNLVRLEEYDAEGFSWDCWKFEYDDSGRLIREENGCWRYHYGTTGELLQPTWDVICSRIYYYENGNMVRCEELNQDGSLDEWYICKFYYSNDNKLIKIELNNDLYRYEYDSSGRLYRIEHYELHDEEDLKYSNVRTDEDGNIVSLREFEILHYANGKLEKREIYTPPFFEDSDVLTHEFFCDEDGRYTLINNYGDEWEEIYLAGYYKWEYSADTVTVFGYDDDGTQEQQATYKFDSMGLLESITTTAEWLSEEEIEYNSMISSTYLMHNDAIYHGIDSLAFYFNSDTTLHYGAMGSWFCGIRYGI